MQPALFTFETTHQALWGEEVARELGIPCELVPAPPALRARCNLALAVLPDDAERARLALDAAGVEYALRAK